uniref:tetratricopeptide repeat protein n=1 Tax=Methanothrix soehngenii TaxID=2223 RepID=UPI002FD9E7D4
VAWNGTVAPQEIVRSLSLGESVDEAVWSTEQKMLKESLEEKEEKKGAIQAYPFVYAVREPTGLFDPNKKREEMIIGYQELPPMPGMTEGYASGFIDRRKDLLRLYPDLRQGAVNALIITGEPGRGKSVLANRLARMLAVSGYFVLPLGGTPHNPISSARLIEAAGLQLAAAGEYQGLEGTKMLLDSSLPVNERLAVLMELLRSNRILIFWDDLDLEEKTGRISDPHLGELFCQMTKGLHSSRAIISCQKVPADASILPRLARNWKLDRLSQAAFLRFMLQDRIIADGYRKGEIAFDALSDLYSLYERDPSKLEQIRSALARGLPKDVDPLARLAECLSPESLLALQCIAVYDVAMSPAGFTAAAGTDLESIAESLPLWEELSLCYKTGNLWAVHSSARPALREGLSPEEIREAHKRAGRFLEEMAESGRSPELFLFRLDGLLEARGHYLEAGDLAEARRVTARISSYLDRRGYYTELIRLNREILELEPDRDSMNWIAQAYAHQMDLENAAQWYKKALDMAPDAFSYQGLGMIQLGRGEYDLAEESLEKALQIHLGQKDQRGEAAVLQALASIDMMQGHYDSARSRLARSLELAREAKDRAGEAVLLFYLADVDRETGELARATEELDCALAITRDLGDRKGMAASLHGLGMISSQAGEMEMAAEHFREALQVYQELKDQAGEAGALFQLGALAVQMDRIQEGLRLMALSAVVLRSINSDEVKNIEPVVERLASQLNFSQDQFVAMLQEVMQCYVKDRGMGLVKKAWRK